MTITQKIHELYKAKGIKAFSLFVIRKIFRQQPNSLSILKQTVSQGKGIEIGGPSSIFGDKGLLPIYASIPYLDNCNFQNNTLWNSNLQEGQTFQYCSSRDAGYQFIQDGIDLSRIQTGSYDFIVSSHVLEHIANPIKALEEWKRILAPNGRIILILPHKEGNFDHKRPDTSLEHLISDFRNDVQENDLTHLEEILTLHDLSRDPWAGTLADFKLRSADNHLNRSLHHHVFSSDTLVHLMNYIQLDVIHIESIDLTHIVLIAEKKL